MKSLFLRSSSLLRWGTNRVFWCKRTQLKSGILPILQGIKTDLFILRAIDRLHLIDGLLFFFLSSLSARISKQSRRSILLSATPRFIADQSSCSDPHAMCKCIEKESAASGISMSVTRAGQFERQRQSERKRRIYVLSRICDTPLVLKCICSRLWVEICVQVQ